MRRHVPLLLLTLTGLALRLWVAHWAGFVELQLDEIDYHRRALYLLEQGHLPDAFRPPIYPLFLGLLYGIFGPSVQVARLATAVVGALGTPLLHRWLTPHVGARGALVAAGLWALHPTLIGYAHQLLSETLFLVLLIGAWSMAAPAATPSRGRLAGAGLLFGLAALTRSFLLPLAPLAALAAALDPTTGRLAPEAPRRLLAFLGPLVALTLAWGAHNRAVEGQWIFTETTSGYNLWKGNTPVEHPLGATGPRFPGPFVSVPMFPYEGSKDTLIRLCGEALERDPDSLSWTEVDRCAGALARGTILDDPLAALLRGPRKLLHLFHPNSQQVANLWLGWYGNVPGWAGYALIYGTAVWVIGLLGLGLVGLRRVAQAPFLFGPVVVAAGQVLVCFVCFGSSRFRLPIELLAIVSVGALFRSPPPAR